MGVKVSSFISKFYIGSGIPKSVLALYSNRIIQQVAGGLLGLFLPIFLFEKFQSIKTVLFFYLASYSIYILIAPFGARLASKIGFKKALTLSVFGGTIYYTCLNFIDINLLIFSIIGLMALNFDRMFYWVPYHSGFAKFTDKKTRGRTLAVLISLVSIITIFLPVISGFAISNYGFNFLFIFVILIYISSMIPFFFIPRIDEFYSFSYWQTWKILLHKRDRRILFTYMSDGAESIIGTVIWPIFIFEVLKGNYQAVGLISSLIILFTILLRLIMGKYTDKFNKKKLLHYGTVLYSAGWLIKMFVKTGFHIFIASTYHNFASIAMRMPYDALMYEKAADAGHYVDEYSVLREMSLNLGRVFIIGVILILFNYFNLQYTFIFAAIAALFINLI